MPPPPRASERLVDPYHMFLPYAFCCVPGTCTGISCDSHRPALACEFTCRDLQVIHTDQLVHLFLGVFK